MWKITSTHELQRLMPLISRGVLTQQLRELEQDKLINREVYKEVPPKVEYSLTELGRSFKLVMIQIMDWVLAILMKRRVVIWKFVRKISFLVTNAMN